MESKEDYFSLKWSNFRSSFSEGFHDFLQEEAMVDVTLAVEGKFVQAHKLVLSVCSPYFKSLFKANPCKHPIVILKDVGHSDISYILDFMYKGEVRVKHEDLPSFLKLAETLRVKGLAGEKIELENENHTEYLATIRKKLDGCTDVDKKCTKFQSSSEQTPKKLLKSRKRRLSCKTESVKKLKSEKCEVSSVRNCVSNDCDNLSEEEDGKPLLGFMRDSNVKFKKSSIEGESQCDNENESQCDNKTSFSNGSDGFPDSEDSGGPDIHCMLQSDYSEETEETPQGASRRRPSAAEYKEKVKQLRIANKSAINVRFCCDWDFYTRHYPLPTPRSPLILGSSKRTFQVQREDYSENFWIPGHLRSLIISRAPRAFVWDYFLKETHQAICLNCGKTFKGQRPNTICEQHLKRRHPEFYKILLQKKIKRAELHMNPMIMRMGLRSCDQD